VIAEIDPQAQQFFRGRNVLDEFDGANADIEFFQTASEIGGLIAAGMKSVDAVMRFSLGRCPSGISDCTTRFDDCAYTYHVVVPAKAGTHTPCRRCSGWRQSPC
jgi:hypothetical protein